MSIFVCVLAVQRPKGAIYWVPFRATYRRPTKGNAPHQVGTRAALIHWESDSQWGRGTCCEWQQREETWCHIPQPLASVPQENSNIFQEPRDVPPEGSHEHQWHTKEFIGIWPLRNSSTGRTRAKGEKCGTWGRTRFMFMCLPVPGPQRNGRSLMNKEFLESFHLCGKMVWDPYQEEKSQCFLHESSGVSLWERLWPSLWPPPPPFQTVSTWRSSVGLMGRVFLCHKQEESDK